MFCECCVSIFNGPGPDYIDRPGSDLTTRTLHPDLHSLMKSSEKGCQICRRILSKVMAKGPEYSHESTKYHLFFSNVYQHILLDIQQPEGFTDTTLLCYFLRELPHESSGRASYPNNIKASSTASDQTLATAASWLEHCTNEHINCSPIQGQVWSPSRLLDIGGLASDQIVLRSREDHLSKEPYIALSHCWGSVAMDMRLTAASITSLKKGISTSHLPRLFRDVIAVVRRLKVRYLWIDSLCIMQDSIDDWKTEASQMIKVYGHAYCTIAATCAADSTHSLFNEHIGEDTIVKTAWKSHEPHKYSLLPRSLWADDLDEDNSAPLSRRAWVVQEQLLSSRVLHFARTQIFWECQAESYCEVYPLYTMHQYCTGWSGDKLLFEYSDPVERWRRTVERYSKCRLTRLSDKLIAIAGVAQSLQGKIEGGYVSGVWIQHAARFLLWEAVEAKDTLQRKDQSSRQIINGETLPTWSWMSFDGGVSYEMAFADSTAESCIKLSDASYSHERSEDNFIAVRRRSLILLGRLRAVRLRKINPLVEGAYDLYFMPYFEYTSVASGEPWCGVEVVVNFDERTSTSQRELDATFLPLQVDRESDEVRGIIVLSTIYEDRTCYERVGIFSTSLICLDSDDTKNRDPRLKDCSLHEKENYCTIEHKHFLGWEDIHEQEIEII